MVTLRTKSLREINNVKQRQEFKANKKKIGIAISSKD